MDFKTQLKGLNELLSVIYGDEMDLNTLLSELGFEQTQIEQRRIGVQFPETEDYQRC